MTNSSGIQVILRILPKHLRRCSVGTTDERDLLSTTLRWPQVACYTYIYNVELQNLYFLPSQIRIMKSRRMRWAWHVARTGEKRIACRIFVGKAEGKRPLGRPRRRCEDNIKVDLGEIGWSGMDWIDLAQERDQWKVLVNTVLNLRVP
jgi:hypothetical protein